MCPASEVLSRTYLCLIFMNLFCLHERETCLPQCITGQAAYAASSNNQSLSACQNSSNSSVKRKENELEVWKHIRTRSILNLLIFILVWLNGVGWKNLSAQLLLYNTMVWMSLYNYNAYHLPRLDWISWPGMNVTEDCSDRDTPLLACAGMDLDSNTDCLPCESNFHLVNGSKYYLKILKLPVLSNT